MRAFVYCVLPIGVVFASIAIQVIKNKIPNKIVSILFLFIILFDFFNPRELFSYSKENNEFFKKQNNTVLIKKTITHLPEGFTTVLNVGNDEHLDLMFYANKAITAYQGVFKKDEMDSLSNYQKPIAVFKTHGKWILPDYVLKYPYLYIIPYELND